jgi:hypothetical protein
MLEYLLFAVYIIMFHSPLPEMYLRKNIHVLNEEELKYWKKQKKGRKLEMYTDQ